MKKTIRLTESELVKLVQKIIKEDEMVGNDMNSSDSTLYKGLVMTTMKNLLINSKNVSWNDSSTSNDYDYFKKYNYFFKVTSGDVWETSPGGPSPMKRPLNSLDKKIFMKNGTNAEIEFITSKKSRGDSYELQCQGNKITLKPSSTVGP